MKTRRGVALLGLAMVTSACEGKVAAPIGEERQGPPQRGGTLRTAFFTDVRSLDAATAFDTASSAIESLIYDRLVSYDAEGKITPELALSADVEDDGKRYVFVIRRGVIMHDGSELTPADVKRSMERALHSKTPCPVPSYYERIVGYHAFHDGKAQELSGIKIEGETVLSIQLTEPDATFLHVMALPIAAPLCKSAGNTWDRNFSSSPCGSGPFKVERYENGQIIRLVRHDGYWQKGKPYLDAIEWYLSMQSFTQRFKFERGDIDYIREFSEADSQLYRTSPAWKGRGEWEPSLTTAGSFMNTQMAPFDNRHLRRAIAFGINRVQVAAIRPGHVQAQHKVVPEVLIPSTPSYPGQHFDYDRALEEMRLAGFAYDPQTGKGGYPEEIPYMALIDSYSSQAAEVYKQQLERIGIRIRIQLVGWPTFLAKSSRRNSTQMGFVGWHADFPDASTFFEPILSTKAIQDEESQNAAFFSNAELDSVLEKARRSPRDAERLRLYARAEAIVAEEAPWATAYAYRYFELWQPYVHGYRPHPVLTQYVRDMWFDRDARKLARGGGCRGIVAALSRHCRSRARTTLAAVSVLP
ncbi:MAG: ABC transporter substrate-binding protein [Polyangiaceae bacterium]